MARFQINGYGQLELNQVAFRRNGRNEAQCKLDDSQFGKEAGKQVAEVGMLLAIDKAAGLVKLPDMTAKKLPIALNYSTEHMYDERENALKDFFMVPGSFLPRMGYLDIGDRFTTNCISLDTGFANLDAVKTAIKTSIVYGGCSADGSILISSTKPTYGPVLQVAKVYTMPDGQPGVKFMCLEQ